MATPRKQRSLVKIVDYRGSDFREECFVLDSLKDRVLPLPIFNKLLREGVYPMGTVVEYEGNKITLERLEPLGREMA